jgi:hypothetical protein
VPGVPSDDEEPPGRADWALADRYLSQRPTKWRSLSWIAARTLIASVNDRLIRLTQEQVGDLRRYWVDGQEGDDLVIRRHAHETRFLVAGDPGEQDGSQYVVAPALARAADAEGVGFLLLLSDVIYPSGDINDYVDGFYKPYASRCLGPDAQADYADFHVNKPIYAIPGNHDWYDGLLGFAYHFLLGEELTKDERRRFERRLAPDPEKTLGCCRRIADRFGRTMWRRSDDPNRATRAARTSFRRLSESGQAATQPGPYFVLETLHLDVVCIDTGLDGLLDDAQRLWLQEVAAARRDRPRVLMTGKPLVVNGKRKAEDEGDRLKGSFGWLEAHVRDRGNGYIAVIGGDVHNFQEYRDEQQPDLVHLVSGGAGAYTHATHPIRFAQTDPRIELSESPERGNGLFPHPAESLSYFTTQLVPSVWRLSRSVFWFLAALVGAYWLRDVDWRWTVIVQEFSVTFDPLGAAAVAFLFTLAVRSLLHVSRTALLQRFLGVTLATLAGAVTMLFSLAHLGADTGPLLAFYVWSTGWLCLNALGLRLTEWWRPVARGNAPGWRRAIFWAGLPVSLALAFAASQNLGGLNRLETGAILAFGLVALWGWFSRISDSDPFGADADVGSARWLSRSVVCASLAQALVVTAMLLGVLRDVERVELLYCLAAILPLLAIAIVCLALPLLADVTFLLPVSAEAKRTYWLRASRGLRALVMAAPFVIIGLWGWLADTTAAMALRAGFGPSALLVLIIGCALAVDLLRRRLGNPYAWLVAALVAAAVVVLNRLSWYDEWPFVAIAASMLTLMAIGVAVLATHLVFVGALWLLFYWGAHRNPTQGSPLTPADNGHWSFLSARDAVAIVRARQTATLEAFGSPARPSRRGWRLARIAFPGLNPPFGPIQRFVSELFSMDEPPFFKHFLELSTTENHLVIHVHRVRGDLPVEINTITIPLPRGPQP